MTLFVSEKKLPLYFKGASRIYYKELKGMCYVKNMFYQGVVQSLRGQDEVGSWSKNVNFCPRSG